MAAQVVIVGSCITDMITYCPRFPRPGETLVGTDFKSGCGGKGANQAVAAARLGASVAIVAKVGADALGRSYVEGLSSTGVAMDHVTVCTTAPTGVAAITVDAAGQNNIVIVPGANLLLSVEDVDRAGEVVRAAAVLVCQCEVPMEVTSYAIQYGRKHGVVTLFNAAPAPAVLPPGLLSVCDIFCVNETEAATLSGLKVSCPVTALSAAQHFVAEGCTTAVVTLGSQGSVFYNKQGNSGHVPAPVVQAVDSTGAGDAFVGALAYYLAYHKTLSLEEMLRRCSAVAAASVRVSGTQTSFPRREDLPEELFQ